MAYWNEGGAERYTARLQNGKTGGVGMLPIFVDEGVWNIFFLSTHLLDNFGEGGQVFGSTSVMGYIVGTAFQLFESGVFVKDFAASCTPKEFIAMAEERGDELIMWKEFGDSWVSLMKERLGFCSQSLPLDLIKSESTQPNKIINFPGI